MVGGDHYTDSRRIPVAITDERELIQRALLRLCVRKGSFAEDPELGSELYKLQGVYGEHMGKLAQSYVQEALLPMPELSVSSVRVGQEKTDIMRLYVNLDIAAETYRLEVDIV